MKYESIFITGANRGIGYELVKQLIAKDDAPRLIFATYRSADTLQDLKALQESSTKSRVVLIKMDVNDPEAIDVARQIVEANVGDEGLHVLINNSGIAEALAIEKITSESMTKHFLTNAVAPMMIAQALLPLLEKSPVQENGYRSAILNISSTMGSIESVGNPIDFIVPSYKISKAALNMGMKINSYSLKEKNILVVMMCPGWVKTDMGGKEIAELEPEDSVSAIIKTLGELNGEHQGAFVNRFGKPVPF